MYMQPPAARSKAKWHTDFQELGEKAAATVDVNDLIDCTVNWHETEPSFYASNTKTKPTTTSAAVAVIKSQRVDIHDRITNASKLKSIAFITEMHAIMQSLEASFNIHPARSAAIVTHILGTTEESKIQNRIKSIIRKYLRTPDDKEDTFIRQCTECELTATEDDLQQNIHLHNSPGYQRLLMPDPEDSWLNMFMGIIQASAYTPKKNFDLTQLRANWEIPPTNEYHPLKIKYRETLQDCIDRMDKALIQLTDACHITSKTDRIPKDYQLAQNLLRAMGNSPIKKEAATLIMDPAINPAGIDLDDMTHAELIKYLRLAEKRIQKIGLQEKRTTYNDASKGKGKTGKGGKGKEKNGKGSKNRDNTYSDSYVYVENKNEAASKTKTYKCRKCSKYHEFSPDREYIPGTDWPCPEHEKQILQGDASSKQRDSKEAKDKFSSYPTTAAITLPAVMTITLPHSLEEPPARCRPRREDLSVQMANKNSADEQAKPKISFIETVPETFSQHSSNSTEYSTSSSSEHESEYSIMVMENEQKEMQPIRKLHFTTTRVDGTEDPTTGYINCVKCQCKCGQCNGDGFVDSDSNDGRKLCINCYDNCARRKQLHKEVDAQVRTVFTTPRLNSTQQTIADQITKIIDKRNDEFDVHQFILQRHRHLNLFIEAASVIKQSLSSFHHTMYTTINTIINSEPTVDAFIKPTNKIIPTPQQNTIIPSLYQDIPMAIPICAPTFTSPHPPECKCNLCATSCGGTRSQCEFGCTYSEACLTRSHSTFTPIQEEPNEWLTTETIRRSICSECSYRIYADQAIHLPCGCSFHSDCIISICETAHQIILECPDCAKPFQPEQAKPYIQASIRALNKIADQYDADATAIADTALEAATQQTDHTKSTGQIMLDAANQMRAKQQIQTIMTKAQNIRDETSRYETKRPHAECLPEQQAQKKIRTDTPHEVPAPHPTPVTSPAAVQQETAQDRDERQPSGLLAAIAFTDTGKPITYAIDTCAEVTLFTPTITSDEWQTEPSQHLEINGIGGKQKIQTMTNVPISFKYGLPTILIGAHIALPPAGIDLLIGIPTIKALQIETTLAQNRITIKSIYQEIDLEPAYILQKRQQQNLRMLMLCAGIGSGLTTLKEMGYHIQIAHAVETDTEAQLVLKALHPEVKIIYNSVQDINWEHIKHNNYNYLEAGPPCQPWSRCSNPAPKGFNDHRSKPFTICSQIKQKIINQNPQAIHITETVIVHRDLNKDNDKQDELQHQAPSIHQAIKAGSISSRIRKIYTNMIQEPQRSSRNPFLIIPKGATMIDRHSTFPCVVSTPNTHNPPSYLINSVKTPATPNELDAMQGYAPGISDGGTAPYTKGPLHMSLETRTKLIGQAFNRFQYAAYASSIPSIIDSIPYTVPIQINTPKTFEQHMQTLSHKQKVQYFQNKLKQTNYEPIQCWLEPTIKDKAPYQTKIGYANPTNVKEIEYALQQACKQKLMTEVTYKPHYWICSLFGKKKGRTWPDRPDLEVYRPLWDLKPINKALKPQASHYLTYLTSIDELMLNIPSQAEYFATVDLADFYGHIPIHPSSRYLVTGTFNNKYYQAIGCPQGLSHAPMAAAANLTHGLNSTIGNFWRSLMASYCDDFIIWGETEQITLNRLQILKAVLETLGFPISNKLKEDENPVKKLVKILGIEITKGGNRLSQTAIDMLTTALSKDQKSKTMLLHTLGVINYSKNAFDFPIGKITQVADLISILREPLKQTKMQWTDRHRDAAKQLSTLITNSNRRLRNPATMLNKNNSIVITHDASDTNIAAAIWTVEHPNAEEITLEMMQNTPSQLIDIKYKVISGSRLAWATFEKELWSKIMAAIEWGPLIYTAVMALAKQLNTTPDKLQSKVLFLGDSTTAEAKWTTILEPDNTHQLQHLSAKLQRFEGWITKLSLWYHIPHISLKIPGPLNHISHTCTHIADILSNLLQQRRKEKQPNVWPVRLHTFHSNNSRPSHLQPPEHFVVHSLNLTQEQIPSIVKAYTLDTDTTIQKVPLNELYKAMSTKTIDTKSPHYEKIKAWAGTRFWALSPFTDLPPLIYTQASTQRLLDYEKHDLGTDLTKVLVLVIPDRAEVQIAASESFIEQTTTEDHWANQWLREQLIWTSHATSHPHRTAEDTISLTQTKAWWPTLIRDCQATTDACHLCVELRTATLNVGNSVMSKTRWGITQVDYKILQKEIAEKCKHPAILVMTDITTGITAAAKATSEDAVTTGRIFYTNWIAQYAIPYLVISDPGSGLAANIMKTISQILGVHEWSYGAAHDSKHQAAVERKNAVFKKVIKAAWDRGALANAEDLDLVIAEALIVINQLTNTHGTTAYERAYMAKPRTVHQTQLASSIDNIQIPTENEMDQKFIKQLANIQKTLLQDYHIHKEHRARSNALYREHTEKSKTTTTFDLRIGDTISYGGIKWLLKETEGPSNQHPISAIITRKLLNGKEEQIKVQYNELKPVCDPVYEIEAPKSNKISINDFILVDVRDKIYGGIVTQVNQIDVHMHECTPSESGRTWIYEWDDDGKRRRQKKKPSITSKPIILRMMNEDIIAVGYCNPATGAIDKTLINKLKSVDVIAAYTNNSTKATQCSHNYCQNTVNQDDAEAGTIICDLCIGITAQECAAQGGLCAHSIMDTTPLAEDPEQPSTALPVTAYNYKSPTPSKHIKGLKVRTSRGDWLTFVTDPVSDRDLISHTALKPYMDKVKKPAVPLKGVGPPTKPARAVNLNINISMQIPTLELTPHVTDLPMGIDGVIGIKTIDTNFIKINSPQNVITITKSNTPIKIRPIYNLSHPKNIYTHSKAILHTGEIIHFDMGPSKAHTPKPKTEWPQSNNQCVRKVHTRIFGPIMAHTVPATMPNKQQQPVPQGLQKSNSQSHHTRRHLTPAK